VRTYFETIPRRPLLLLLPGVHEEGHGYYLKRTEWKLLKEFLKVRPNKTGQNASQAAQSENDKDIHLKVIKIQHGLRISDSVKSIREEIAKVIGPVSEDDKFLPNYVTANKLQACLIVAEISANHWKGDYERPVKLLCEYLAKIPQIPSSTLFGGQVCLCDDRTQNEKKGWLKDIIRHIGQASKETKWPSEHSTKIFCEQLSKEYPLQIEFLPRLDSPTVKHGLDWKDEDEVQEWVRTFSPNVPLTDKEIKESFEFKNSLPMRPLHDKLLGLLNKRVTR
jgi:hypothetical protein